MALTTYERMNLDIEPIIRGDAYEIEVDVLAGMEGMMLYMTLKEYLEDEDDKAIIQVAHEIEAGDVSAGSVSLMFSGIDTSQVPTGQRLWLDVQISDSENPTTLIRGSTTAIADVTRRLSGQPTTGIETLWEYSTTDFVVEAA